MIIGVRKEIKSSENTVALIPSGVQALVKAGHSVYVQYDAGEGSGFSKEDHIQAGAKTLNTIEEIYGIAEIIIKVKVMLVKDIYMGKKL